LPSGSACPRRTANKPGYRHGAQVPDQWQALEPPRKTGVQAPWEWGGTFRPGRRSRRDRTKDFPQEDQVRHLVVQLLPLLPPAPFLVRPEVREAVVPGRRGGPSRRQGRRLKVPPSRLCPPPGPLLLCALPASSAGYGGRPSRLLRHNPQGPRAYPLPRVPLVLRPLPPFPVLQGLVRPPRPWGSATPPASPPRRGRAGRSSARGSPASILPICR